MAARTLCECAFKPRAWLVPISVLLVLCAADVTEARRGSRSIEGAPKGTAAFGASETPVTDESTPSETEGKKSKRGKSRRGKAKLDKATEELLRQTGLPREKFDEVLSIGRRYVAESEWDTRHHMKYMGERVLINASYTLACLHTAAQLIFARSFSVAKVRSSRACEVVP
eukprot:SAG11_NODE_1539_length_4722_cov_4.377028_9_plen_170_part_00